MKKYKIHCKYCDTPICGGKMCYNCKVKLRLIRKMQKMIKERVEHEKKFFIIRY